MSWGSFVLVVGRPRCRQARHGGATQGLGLGALNLGSGQIEMGVICGNAMASKHIPLAL